MEISQNSESNITQQIDEAFVNKIDPHLIEMAVAQTLQFAEQPEQSLTVVITDNEAVRQLNQQFRGIDSATDVLSFANEADPDFPGVEPDYLGDIIIAYPFAEAQALAAGHAPMNEVILLVIHGTLHLLGYDHDTPDLEAEMWDIQRQILTAVEGRK